MPFKNSYLGNIIGVQRQKMKNFTNSGLKKVKQINQRATQDSKQLQIKRKQQNNYNARLRAKYGAMYDPNKVRQQQQELVKAGYNIVVDGDWGEKTEQAWRNYQLKKNQSKNSQDNFKGIQIPTIPVDRLGNKTLECATFSNTWMRNNGIKAGGDAYQVGRRYSPVINGYDGMNLQRGVSNKQIMDYHRQAADRVQQNLDTLSLQKGHMYPVNMYYTTSPHMQEFYNKSLDENTKTPGTHTGVLYNNGNQWMVGHNIHGIILNNPVSEVLGGKSNPHKYGITAVYDAGATKQYPDKKQNRSKGLLNLGFLGL